MTMFTLTASPQAIPTPPSVTLVLSGCSGKHTRSASAGHGAWEYGIPLVTPRMNMHLLEDQMVKSTLDARAVSVDERHVDISSVHSVLDLAEKTFAQIALDTLPAFAQDILHSAWEDELSDTPLIAGMK